MRQFYYKMEPLLQNATILLQNVTIITKRNVYYKLRQYMVESLENKCFNYSLGKCMFSRIDKNTPL